MHGQRDLQVIAEHAIGIEREIEVRQTADALGRRIAKLRAEREGRRDRGCCGRGLRGAGRLPFRRSGPVARLHSSSPYLKESDASRVPAWNGGKFARIG